MVSDAYDEVEAALAALEAAAEADFRPYLDAASTEYSVAHDALNEGVWLKKKARLTKAGKAAQAVYQGLPALHTPSDRRNKTDKMQNFFSSEAVDDAARPSPRLCRNAAGAWRPRVSRAFPPASHPRSHRRHSQTERYIDAVLAAEQRVKDTLIDLSDNLRSGGYVPCLALAAQFALVSRTWVSHAREMQRRCWTLPTLLPAEPAAVAKERSAAQHQALAQPGRGGERAERSPFAVSGLWPYWIERADAVPTSFDCDGIFLLTGEANADSP